PHQGCAGGAAECSIDRRASDHHGSHGCRKAEEGKWGARHAWRWHGGYGRYGLLSPALTEMTKARDFFRAFFLVPQSRKIRALSSFEVVWNYRFFFFAKIAFQLSL